MLGIESQEQAGESHLGLVAARFARHQGCRDSIEAAANRRLDFELWVVDRLGDCESAPPVADTVLDLSSRLLAEAGDAVDPERGHREQFADGRDLV